jgi:ATP-dependent protease HslVU (ClpYQ) peptidase subunit
MTCIIGFKQLGKVIIAGDSAGVAGLDVVIRKDAKVFKVGEFVMGGTTSFRMIQLLRFSFNPPKYHDGEDVYEYMCTKFVDEIRATFKRGGFAEIDKNVDRGGTFLVGFRDRLFDIQGDFQVGEVLDGIDACGCGESYALAAMKAMGKDIDPIRVLEIVTHFSGGVRPPYVIEST